ncbi:sensor histidine kinase [Parasphingorhabdus cellanae]|uniref:histidine kinase n=1 Tax=Parasphingorhabdus cellanae TaxID=2806553 RepID=A0ABX7TAF6_9SPHN|nr:HWE histidine kinase domain-containing protein [Parasphingorhabdus cellanae]QTD57387.1 PAS domain-containing protein [Parasphingorhabdus cellanae]
MQQKNISTPFEDERLATLDSYKIMDSPPEVAFDRLTRLAADIFEVPMASVSLIDDKRQWFKSAVGLDERETPRDVAFCSHIIEHREAMVIEDASNDSRFDCNPLVTGPPFIAFYAGYPLISPNGMVIGTLWIGDKKNRRRPSDDQLDRLRSMAEIVMSELELRREVEQRKAAQQEAAQSRLDLELALALSSTASWTLNLSNDKVSWGGAYFKVWGKDADQALTTGDEAFARIHPEDRERIRNAMNEAALPDSKGYEESFRIVLPSGETRWLSGRGNFVRNRNYDAITGINYDITKTIIQQEEQKLHTRELHHRLRNLFATLQSIMTLTKNSATSIDDYIERIEGRLRALNRAQQILLDANFVTGSFAALVNDLCATYPRITWAGPDISLPENAMVSISLVLNELATNAAKYGALNHEDGTVTINWTITDDAPAKKQTITLLWQEQGGPALPASPSKTGFGSSLIDHSVGRNLKGEIVRDWQKDGLVCSISFPLAESEH